MASRCEGVHSLEFLEAEGLMDALSLRTAPTTNRRMPVGKMLSEGGDKPVDGIVVTSSACVNGHILIWRAGTTATDIAQVEEEVSTKSNILVEY